MAEATEKGYNVAKLSETGNPFCMYDFVLDDGIKMFRVEVKTSDYRHHKYNKNDQKVCFKLKRGNGLSYNVDLFALVCPKISKIAWIQAETIGHKNREIVYYKDFKHHELPVNKNSPIKFSEDIIDHQMNLF